LRLRTIEARPARAEAGPQVLMQAGGGHPSSAALASRRRMPPGMAVGMCARSGTAFGSGLRRLV
jgi:hypothetical protein